MAGQRVDDPIASMQTWGVPDGGRVWVGGHNLAARRAVEALLLNVTHPPEGPIDRAFITPQTVDEAGYFAVKLRTRLVPDAVVWVVVPQRFGAAGLGFAGTRDELQMAMFERGFLDRRGAILDDNFRSIGFIADSAMV